MAEIPGLFANLGYRNPSSKVIRAQYAWEEPTFSRFRRRLASFSRLILLDRRGTGLSDPVAELPSLELRMDDVRAVMDVAGSERAALFVISEGGPMCMMFAATYPQRTAAIHHCHGAVLGEGRERRAVRAEPRA